MMLSFATCDRGNALRFLKKIFPDKIIEDTKDSVGLLLDMISEDKVRVLDPDFHRAAIVEGKNFTPDLTSKIGDILTNLGLAHSPAEVKP